MSPPKHAVWIRWTHWINFPLLTLMIWSGTLIYWANDIYPGFFPKWVYRTFPIAHRLAEGMAIHFLVMWLFALNGVVYTIYLFASGKWREVFPDRYCGREAWQVVRHDLGLGPAPVVRGKMNAAQRITYTAILFMGMGSIFTGLAIYKPVQLHALTWMCGGYAAARFIHFALTVGFVLFFFVHVLQVARAGWNNFRAMVTGYETEGS